MGIKLSGVVAIAQRHYRTAFLFLSLAFCLTLIGLRPSAQELKILSKDRKAPIGQIFYPDRNETAVIAPVGPTEETARLFSSLAATGPSTKTLQLWDAQYVYPGKNPTRPRGVSFTFYVHQGQDKFKGKQSFSVIGDGAVVHQGDLSLEKRTVGGDSKTATQDVLTVTIPTDVFLSLSKAKKVEFKFGPKTYKLSGDQQKHIRALAETIEPLS